MYKDIPTNYKILKHNLQDLINYKKKSRIDIKMSETYLSNRALIEL